MKKNTGNIERIARVVLGVAILSILFWVETGWRWLGLVGIVPIVTGISGWCALYALLGIGTRKIDTKKPSHV